MSQAITTNLMGTALGMGISVMVTVSHTATVLPIILGLSSIHILAVYQSLKYIHDPLINVARCQWLALEFMQRLETGKEGEIKVLTKPQEMSENEEIFGFGTTDKRAYRVNVGQRIDKWFGSIEDLENVMDFYGGIDCKYWMTVSGQGTTTKSLNIWFLTDAQSEDVLDAMLAVGFMESEDSKDGARRHSVEDDANEFVEVRKAIEFARDNGPEWRECLERSAWDIDNLYIELQTNRIET